MRGRRGITRPPVAIGSTIDDRTVTTIVVAGTPEKSTAKEPVSANGSSLILTSQNSEEQETKELLLPRTPRKASGFRPVRLLRRYLCRLDFAKMK